MKHEEITDKDIKYRKITEKSDLHKWYRYLIFVQNRLPPDFSSVDPFHYKSIRCRRRGER